MGAAATGFPIAMRLLQLSDPHLLADPTGLCRGRPSLALLRHAFSQAHDQLQAAGLLPERLLISGDLCQDESWGGYRRLAEVLADSPFAALEPPLLLAGNHDHALALRAALGRQAVLAPALLDCGSWQLLLLDSHVPHQLRHQAQPRPLLVAVHHPPLPIGDATMDAIGLRDGEPLLQLLRAAPGLRGLVFGHVHQYWQGVAARGAGSAASGVPVHPLPLRPRPALSPRSARGRRWAAAGPRRGGGNPPPSAALGFNGGP